MSSAGNNTWTLSPTMQQRTYLIDDIGGYDQFDFTGFNSGYNLYIDLRPSNVPYRVITNFTSNFALQFTSGTYIEDAFGGQGSDQIIGNDYSNRLFGSNGNDTIWGMGGADRLIGGFHHDTLIGGTGDDFLAGESGGDTLSGESGNDTLSAGDGNDVLVGGQGQDQLIGEAGSDVFRFVNAGYYNDWLFDSRGGDSTVWVSNPDTITGFDSPGGAAGSYGDIIDLRYIDAYQELDGGGDTRYGQADNSFKWYGYTPYDLQSFGMPAYSVAVTNSGQYTVVRADIDGGGAAELTIWINDGVSMTAQQYSWTDFWL